MSPDNFDLVFEALHQARPFLVYTMEMTDGELLEIDGPATLVIDNGMAVFNAPTGIRAIFDHTGVLRVYNATAAEVVDMKKSLAVNRG